VTKNISAQLRNYTTVEQQMRPKNIIAQLSATVVQIIGIVVVADFVG
jgi:hypothetical protein